MSLRHSALLVAVLGFSVGVPSCGSTAGSPADTTGAGSITNTDGVGGGTTSTGDGGTTTTSDGGTTTTATTGAPIGCVGTTLADGSLDLQVSAGNNYVFESTITLSVIPIAPNTPLHFDWSGLTTDITQQPIDPTSGEVQAVVLALLELTQDAFQMKLNANERLTSFSKGAIAFYPTSQTSANLYEFSGLGSTMPAPATEIDPYLDPNIYPPVSNIFAVLVQDVKDPGRGVRMVQALQMDVTSVNTEVVISDSSADLTYHTDLTTVVPVQVPAGTANITADWNAMQGGLNGLGDLWKDRSVDNVMVGHYSLTPAELTAEFLALDKVADELYRGPAAPGAKVALTTLTEETSGAPFPGIDATGTWVLALNCSDCANPAPWFLTILEPCP